MAAKAIQRGVRQSARKMRLVIDTIRGQDVNQAYALLKFSKKHLGRATPIHKRSSSVEIRVAAREES
uniref:50S ribosomal protein L22 n=1 Tax=uncultured Gemmatimonadetes bacterium Rifle_16ft_4_minimus_34782 TaxID=1665096 RepID=A0A0H4T3C9_9BACT|nr:hypothetical protein [uncultured Gemmatimonadetes bacterium Rifle_16ft_4_minimus_34782]